MNALVSPAEGFDLTDAGYEARAHTGKRSYPSKHVAKLVARRTNTIFGGIRKQAYRCRFCHRWHVGSDPHVSERRYRNVTPCRFCTAPLAAHVEGSCEATGCTPETRAMALALVQA